MVVLSHPSSVRAVLRCSCGGSLRGAVSRVEHAQMIRDVFLSVHTGDGCSVVDRSYIRDRWLLDQEGRRSPVTPQQ